jgi:hypothetical protein
MRLLYLLLAAGTLLGLPARPQQQKTPCTTNPVYRQFDFWIGNWEVYDTAGKKAGDSQIELILDSCIILENWKSARSGYAGKSFNTYNAITGQWQQNWVDNAGESIAFTEGKFDNHQMQFLTKPYPVAKDTLGIRRLTFYQLAADKVRQHGELSKDGGQHWSTEYDLEYRRKKL